MTTAVTRRVTPVTFTGSEAVAECVEGESILLAGLRAGLDLAYECASGGCGSCRAQLLRGSVTSRWPAAPGLSERDRRKGDRILLCQSLPLEGCEVRVPGVEPADGREPRPARLTGRLVARDLLSADTARLVLVADEEVRYLAGQFVLVEFDDGVRRAYSMSRAWREHEPAVLELLVRAKPGGAASAWLFDRLALGSTLRVEGPYGRAYAQSPPDRPVVCLAGGTGLAPVLAIAEDLLAGDPGRELTVYVGARRGEDLVLAERLAGLVDAGATVVTAVEDGRVDHPVIGPARTGLALDHLAEDRPDLGDHDLYLAGPTGMVDAGLRRLVRAGTARADRVYFDRFLA